MNIIDKPDIRTEMERAGAIFRKSGSAYICHCLLHQERTPSCYVDLDKQVFYCHGCGKGGDVIQFIMELRGCDFKEALRYLGIEQDRPYQLNPEVQEAKYQREMIDQFREWEKSYFTEISDLYRSWNLLKPLLAPEQVEEYADFYKWESIWQHHLDILSYVGDDPEKDRDKFELYQEQMAKAQAEKERDARIDRAYEQLKAAERRLRE